MGAMPTLGVVGARGAVGTEILRMLLQQGWAADRLLALGSPERTASSLQVTDHLGVELGEVPAAPLGVGCFPGLDEVVFAASETLARDLAPQAVAAGARVVDVSAAFRGSPRARLVVAELMGKASPPAPGEILASPNCSTILAALALEPIRTAIGLEAVTLSTYQAVSGAGLAGVAELRAQSAAHLQGEQLPPKVFPVPSGFNVFPHEAPIDPSSGANGEEQEIVQELHQLWGEEQIDVEPCCVRVPVERCHSQSIRVQLSQAVTEDRLVELLANGAGLRHIPDGHRITPHHAAHGDEILLGRVRPARIQDAGKSTKSWRLWLCGDQLRVGAAGNALKCLAALRG